MSGLNCVAASDGRCGEWPTLAADTFDAVDTRRDSATLPGKERAPPFSQPGRICADCTLLTWGEGADWLAVMFVITLFIMF